MKARPQHDLSKFAMTHYLRDDLLHELPCQHARQRSTKFAEVQHFRWAILPMCTRSGFDDLLQEEQVSLAQPLTRDPLLMHTCAIRAPAEQLDNSGERMLSSHQLGR